MKIDGFIIACYKKKNETEIYIKICCLLLYITNMEIHCEIF